MADNSLQKLGLTITVGEKAVKDYESLNFDSFASGNRLDIIFKSKPPLSEGDTLTGTFNGKSYFTCQANSILPGKNSSYIVTAREPYYSSLRTALSPVTWVKTSLHEVLSSLLGSIGISADYSSCPDTDIAHLSVREGMTPFNVLDHLFRYSELASGVTLCARPAPDGLLQIGPEENLRVESDCRFIRGDNLLSQDRGRITALAAPVLYNQTVRINRVDHVCRRAILSCKPGRYRLYMEVK